MIPLDQKRDVSSGGVEGSASFEISGKDAAHIMTILRDTLYSDKVLAVLREYAANAWDANRVVGRGDVPIKITLPTYSDSTLKIRDLGPGLSVDDVFEVYNKYGSSTKRGDNLAVGMLGIGSKSGFAYSDSFTIISWHGGCRATYVAVIDESEKGRVDLLDIHTLDATKGEDITETGVEIRIPVKPSDIHEFERKAQTLFAYFEPRPQINTTLPPIQKGQDFEGLGRICEKTDDYHSVRGQWVAVMGCIPYRIQLSQLQGLSSSASNISGILWFDVGAIQFSASREELKYSDITKKVLVERINEIIDKYIEHLLAGIDQLTPWARRLRIKYIKNMYLVVPGYLKHLEDNYLQFKKDPAFTLKSRGWKGKLSNSDGFKVADDTRLVFRDEKKLLAGYTMLPGDVIVDPLLDVFSARKALNQQIKDMNVDGIPVIKISTLPWVKPITAPRQVDLARSRAHCLILDPNNLYADRKSERWTPTVRVPLDTDVWVILDSYVVDGLSDFYESYENDKSLLEAKAIGGKMPQIIGYRNTKAHPVDRSKLKGTEFKVWRQKGYVELLTAHPNVSTGLAAKVWSNVSAYGVDSSIVAKFGADHPVGDYIANVLKGTKDYYGVGKDYHAAIYRAHQSMTEADNPAERQWKLLAERYPLLHVQGNQVSMFGGTHKDRWFDYIKIMDLHLEMTENFSNEDDEQKEAA